MDTMGRILDWIKEKVRPRLLHQVNLLNSGDASLVDPLLRESLKKVADWSKGQRMHRGQAPLRADELMAEYLANIVEMPSPMSETHGTVLDWIKNSVRPDLLEQVTILTTPAARPAEIMGFGDAIRWLQQVPMVMGVRLLTNDEIVTLILMRFGPRDTIRPW